MNVPTHAKTTVKYTRTLKYPIPISESQNELRVRPADDNRQSVQRYNVTTTPSSRIHSYADYWDTQVEAFGVRRLHDELTINAEAIVELTGSQLITATPNLADVEGSFVTDNIEYVEPTPATTWTPSIANHARDLIRAAAGDAISAVLSIYRSVGSEYVIGVEAENLETVLETKKGSAHQLTHLCIALYRSLQIPARFVNGFATTNTSHGEATTHSWVEARLPDVDWIGLDPLRRSQIGTNHIKIGHGRDANDVPQLKGVYAGDCKPEITTEITFERSQSKGTR